MNFAALDFETANSDLASVCQIGVVVFENGTIKETFRSLVNPEDEFDWMNVYIHGIDEVKVKDAPRFMEVVEHMDSLLHDRVIVHHGAFDRVAMSRVRTKYELDDVDRCWLDSARVVRRCWDEYSSKGYGLKKVSKALGIEFQHHDACEDARAAGLILLKAIETSGKSIDEWLTRAYQPLREPGYHGNHVRAGDPDGPLAGEVLVFTGALEMNRSKAADLAAAVGCEVIAGVAARTTILVVGDQDVRKLAGKDRSRKHLKAEAMIREGHPIRIIGESDFLAMVQPAKRRRSTK